jgi:hypothetical protein
MYGTLKVKQVIKKYQPNIYIFLLTFLTLTSLEFSLSKLQQSLTPTSYTLRPTAAKPSPGLHNAILASKHMQAATAVSAERRKCRTLTETNKPTSFLTCIWVAVCSNFCGWS